MWFMEQQPSKVLSALGANLPSIHSQEENVFVQHLHGGEHAWLGLSDINSKGTFVWSDETPLDFHYWADHQPNNFQNEDVSIPWGYVVVMNRNGCIGVV